MNEIYDAHQASFEAAKTPEALEEYLGNPDKLYGHRQPQQQLKSEQPWHRLLLYFKARGLSNKECEEKLGVSHVYIGQIARQPWFRQKLVTVLKEEGLPAVQEMLRSSAPESVLNVIELRDNATSESIQANCAMDLLDRYLGKAPTVVSEQKSPLADVDEQKLDARIAELQKVIATGGAPTETGTNAGRN